MYDDHLYENVYFSKMQPKTVQPHNPELLQKTKQQADQIVEILYENVGKVLERQEKLEDLNNTAESLERQAAVFKTRAVQVKRQKQWKHMKTKIVIGIVITLFVLLIIGFIISSMMSGD